jgi:acyl transferase domain-containing protein
MANTSSLSGKCHTFDIKADGYIKAEAVNAIFLKRLEDAIRDGDPIRAVIRGSATNSDGRTPGIASPSAEAQAAAIRAAYANAGLTAFNETSYLECHGTGTQVSARRSALHGLLLILSTFGRLETQRKPRLFPPSSLQLGQRMSR